ncbi:VOC family protein [Rhodanobacter umsongensis]|uniref:VOC family protein n=1 Tax=Rhodanobacter umsongensis TaxID=633153 RepID=A0ABW0JJC7_9GAMM
MQLNHLHICVQDVAAVSSFFVNHFGFNLRETRGRNGFAILKGDTGFVLTLMRLPSEVASEHAYPPMFHVGFLVADEALLESTRASLVIAGCDPSAIEHMRGSRRFYCKAPGGLLIEVGHEPEA